MAADVLCCGWHAVTTTTFHDSAAGAASDVATGPSAATAALAALATITAALAVHSREPGPRRTQSGRRHRHRGRGDACPFGIRVH